MALDSIQDWIFPKEFIVNPRGEVRDGAKTAKERLDRWKTVWFMEDLAKVIKMERRVLSTACVYFHRFFLFHSFEKQNRFKAGLACLFLAGKVEEQTLKIKDLVNAYFYVRYPTRSPNESELRELQKDVILMERLVLQSLGFDLTVIHPNTYCAEKCNEFKKGKFIDEATCTEIHNAARNMIADSFRTTMCLEYPPKLIGVAMLLLSTIHLSVRPVNPDLRSSVEYTFWDLLEKDKELDETTLRRICNEMLDFYDEKMLFNTEFSEMDKYSMRAALEDGAADSYLEISTTKEVSVASSPDINPELAYGDFDDAKLDFGRAPTRTITVVGGASMPTHCQQQLAFSSDDVNDDERASIAYSIAYSDAEETPARNRFIAPDTPSSTPSFRDLQRRRTSRSNSLSEPVDMTCKRVRAE